MCEGGGCGTGVPVSGGRVPGCEVCMCEGGRGTGVQGTERGGTGVWVVEALGQVEETGGAEVESKTMTTRVRNKSRAITTTPFRLRLSETKGNTYRNIVSV